MNSYFYPQPLYYSAYFTVSTLGHVIFHILLHFTETRKKYFFFKVLLRFVLRMFAEATEMNVKFIWNGNNYLWESKRLYSVYFTRSLRFGDIWHHALYCEFLRSADDVMSNTVWSDHRHNNSRTPVEYNLRIHEISSPELQQQRGFSKSCWCCSWKRAPVSCILCLDWHAAYHVQGHPPKSAIR